MEKTTIILLSFILSALTMNIVASETDIQALQSRVQTELSASIKADCLMAERMITLDIEDDLLEASDFAFIHQEYPAITLLHMNHAQAHKMNFYSTGLRFDSQAE